MKNFWSENCYNVVKLFLNQIALSMLGFVMAMATQNAHIVLRVLVGVFCIVFYLWILYVMMYEMGQKDGIKIQSGRLHYAKYKGFWIAFLANIPNIIIGILNFIGGLGYEIIGVTVKSWAAELYFVANAIGKVIQAVYLPLISAILNNEYWTLLVTPVFPIVVCMVAYRLGVKYCDGFANVQKRKNQNRYS